MARRRDVITRYRVVATARLVQSRRWRFPRAPRLPRRTRSTRRGVKIQVTSLPDGTPLRVTTPCATAHRERSRLETWPRETNEGRERGKKLLPFVFARDGPWRRAKVQRRDGVIETLKSGQYLQDAISVDRQSQQRVLELENLLEARDAAILARDAIIAELRRDLAAARGEARGAAGERRRDQTVTEGVPGARVDVKDAGGVAGVEDDGGVDGEEKGDVGVDDLEEDDSGEGEEAGSTEEEGKEVVET